MNVQKLRPEQKNTLHTLRDQDRAGEDIWIQQKPTATPWWKGNIHRPRGQVNGVWCCSQPSVCTDTLH